jgi:hypothetical protein
VEVGNDITAFMHGRTSRDVDRVTHVTHARRVTRGAASHVCVMVDPDQQPRRASMTGS